MPSTNLVISRLQNQRSRIQGMLSPGKKKRQLGGSSLAPLSPVASDFAGRKFQLAAQKMRALDAGKLGQNLSSDLTSLSTDIQSKFADIQKIIHINPGTSREENIWSSVETPLPGGQPARQETSLDPGIMRSGSVIQKMNMVPKPGQSLSSFKDQVQKQPRATKTPTEKKPVINQNTRRFSQVQEVTPGQKQALPEIPAVPVQPDETQTPLIQAKETPGTATIQSQPDPSVSVTEKPVITSRAETPLSKPSESPVKQDLPPEMPLREKPRSSQPVTRTEQQTLPETPQTDKHIIQSADHPQEGEGIRLSERQTEQPLQTELPPQTESPPQVQLPVREKEILKALPVVKKVPVQDELKKALPVKKEQKQPQKPVARPTLKSRIDAPVASVRPTIQRQPEADVSSYAPVRPVIQQPTDTELPVAAPVRPVTQQPTDTEFPVAAPVRSAQQQPQTTAPSIKLTAPPALPETDAGRPEMPLRQNIGYRQNASRAIRVIAPDQMKPVSLPPLIHREDVPLLTRSKYNPVSPQASHPEFSIKKSPSPLPKQDQSPTPFRVPDALHMNLPRNLAPQQAPSLENLLPIPMPLASQIAAPAPVLAAPKTEPANSPVQSQVSQLSRTSSAVSKTNNTIQRTWEGHTGASQNASEKSEGSNNRAESTDLESLAENVFPYVKRILEIEAERSSGKLR